MGPDLARPEIHPFLERLGERFPEPVRLYRLGGRALSFLGSPRRTVDIDCAVGPPPPGPDPEVRWAHSETRFRPAAGP